MCVCMSVCGVCACVCVRRTRLSGEIEPQARGKSILSAQVVVWLWKKDTSHWSGSEFREEKKKKQDNCCFSSSWLEGERGWCDLLHHGMQPLYPAEARGAI